jgi:hypothetical protein
MDSAHVRWSIRGCALIFVAAFVGCSSGSSPVGAKAPVSDGGGTPNGGLDAGPVVGTGMACTAMEKFTTATKIVIDTTWEPAAAIKGCLAPSCSAPFYVWLLANHTVSGTTISATIGPGATTGKIENTFPDSTWQAPDMPIITGTSPGTARRASRASSESSRESCRS